ncbi:MAG TPA: polymorphic toxin-type HINT domain-containing protein [Cellvibrionaceae bacterium]
MKSLQESPAFKRELQLKTKQVDFLKQRVERGVIEKTPLKDIVYDAAEVKQYVREAARRDAEGKIVEPERVIDIKDFAKACDGLVEINAKGEVVYKTCFAAGTLVHTDQGPQPIETLRIGTRVLAQPEQGGKLDYRPIINKVAHLDQQVYAVQVKVEVLDTLTTIITTGNHPFWVEAPLAEGEHWLAAECLEPGFVVQLADGRPASVHAAGLIRRTQYTHLGVATDDRAGVAIVLDLREKHIQLADETLLSDLDTMELGEAFLTPVYNFEVEEFHTYYVGNVGVWVHNTNCPTDTIVKNAADNVALENQCFVDDTCVHIEHFGTGLNLRQIQFIEVGDKVLSRCETTGEMAYKRVLKVFEHYASTIVYIGYSYGSTGLGTVCTTPEHPFWVEGKGWTEVCKLLPGDQFQTHDGTAATVKYVDLSGRFGGEVYNLEVEKFHTYFVDGVGIWVHNTKDGKIQVTLIDTTKVADPKPEWTPLHKSQAEIDAAVNAGTMKPAQKAILENEMATDKVLGKGGIKAAALPEDGLINTSANKANLQWQNGLGKLEGKTPDRVLSSTEHPDLNGVVAEYYRPDLMGSLGSTFEKIGTKTKEQSSVLVVDLRAIGSKFSLGELLGVLDGTKSAVIKGKNGQPDRVVSGPIDTLRILLVIEADGTSRRINYAKTAANELVYAKVTVTESGILTKRILEKDGPIPVGTDPIIRQYDLTDPSKSFTFLEVDAPGVAITSSALSLPNAQSLLPAARQFWLNAGASAIQLDNIHLSVASLAPGIAGMTVGNEITLSTDGAGWGWFVDTTPALQEEFGAGDAAHEFKALSDSVAAGKLDLLTVLVHEIGHTLGHVVGDDYLMAQYLEAGVRRLPSAQDMASVHTGFGAETRILGTTYTTQAPAAQSIGMQTQQVGGWSALGNFAFDSTLTGVTLHES